MKKRTPFLQTSILLLGIILSGLLQSCEPDYRCYEIKQSLSDWGAFKEGTWWVYEEETLKTRDSVYVYKQTEECSKVEDEGPDWRTIKSYTASSLGVDSFYYDIASPGGGGLWIGGKRYRQETRAKCHLSPRAPLDLDAWGRTGPAAQHTFYDTIYSEMELGKHTFTNVLRAFNNMNLAYNWDTTYIYSAKNIGIVRKEFPAYDQVWNLVEYNVVQ